MKDLELRDILLRERPRATKLSVRINGRWQFASFGPVEKRVEGLTYYRMSKTFGLVSSKTNDPKITLERGVPGDFVAVDQFGELNLVKKEVYELRFPKRNTRPATTQINSKKLIDPKFITDIVRKR